MAGKKDTEEEIKKKVEERVKQLDSEETDDSQPAELPDRFIDQCHGDNVMGDAELFYSICKGRFLYNGTSGNWYRWAEHYWEEDLSNSVLAAIGVDVAEQYQNRARRLKEDIDRLKKENKKEELITAQKDRQKDVNKRAFALKGDRAKKVLGWVPAVAPQMVVDGDAFDKLNHCIACQGGVINMETGECKEGDPNDKITLFTPHEWAGLDANPVKFVKSLCCSLEAAYDYRGSEKDKKKFLEDRYEYIHRFIGAALMAHNATGPSWSFSVGMVGTEKGHSWRRFSMSSVTMPPQPNRRSCSIQKVSKRLASRRRRSSQ